MFPNVQGIVVSAIIAFFIGFGVGFNECNKKFIDYKAQVNTIAKVNEEVAKQKEVKSNEVTKEVVANYKSAISSLHVSPSHFGLSSIPKATSGTPETTAYTALVVECSETTVQLNSLQDWVRQQYLINNDETNK